MFREIAERSALKELELFDVYPPARDRGAWERVPREYRRALVQEGEKWLGYGFSHIYAVDYMASALGAEDGQTAS